MNTTGLKKFAQAARRRLLEQVYARLNLVLQTIVDPNFEIIV